tara:strand:+ start:647 stop:895 length:249 start_codon:yes stop_codon:yes gene_type:complete
VLEEVVFDAVAFNAFNVGRDRRIKCRAQCNKAAAVSNMSVVVGPNDRSLLDSSVASRATAVAAAVFASAVGLCINAGKYCVQ